MPHEIRPPPATAHPKIIRLHDYWRAKAPLAGMLPGRQHIDATEIPALLDNIWLLDVVGEPRRFRFRLIGDAMQRKGIPGRPGEYMDQFLSAGVPSEQLAALHAVVTMHRPSWARGAPKLVHKHYISEIERIVLPLAADGRDVDTLLCLTVFYRSDGKEF